MSNEMKITGVAPLIAVPTFLYLILTIIISFKSENKFSIINHGHIALIVLGCILIVIGALMVINCAKKLFGSFSQNKLMTDGLYKIFNDPMYAAYMLFIIPGIAIVFNSWFALTTAILNFVLYSIFIRREHKYLEEKFGEEYLNYRKKVLIKFL